MGLNFYYFIALLVYVTSIEPTNNNQTKSSEQSKHLLNNINLYFTWIPISNAPKPEMTKRNLEVLHISL